MKKPLKYVTLTAMFLGLTAVCKLFSFNIAIFGTSGMRVGFGGIFTAFPAILFGPVYGGMASAASDILGCLIDPQGAYNPLFTISAFLGGFVKGLTWMLLKKPNVKKLRIIIAVSFALVFVFGAAVYVSLASDGISNSIIASADTMPTPEYIENAELSPLSKLVVSRQSLTGKNYQTKLAGYINFSAFGITAVGIFGMLAVLIEFLYSRRKADKPEAYGVKIFTSIFASEFFVTTINTIILKEMTFATQWSSYPFAVVYLPRLAEGLIVCIINAYVITLLYTVSKKKLDEILEK